MQAVIGYSAVRVEPTFKTRRGQRHSKPPASGQRRFGQRRRTPRTPLGGVGCCGGVSNPAVGRAPHPCSRADDLKRGSPGGHRGVCRPRSMIEGPPGPREVLTSLRSGWPEEDSAPVATLLARPGVFGIRSVLPHWPND